MDHNMDTAILTTPSMLQSRRRSSFIVYYQYDGAELNHIQLASFRQRTLCKSSNRSQCSSIRPKGNAIKTKNIQTLPAITFLCIVKQSTFNELYFTASSTRIATYTLSRHKSVMSYVENFLRSMLQLLMVWSMCGLWVSKFEKLHRPVWVMIDVVTSWGLNI